MTQEYAVYNKFEIKNKIINIVKVKMVDRDIIKKLNSRSLEYLY